MLTEKNGGWDRIVITSVRGEQNKRFEGMDLVSIGREMGLDACDAAFELLVTEGMQVGIVRHGMSDDDVATVLSHPLTMVSSDGRALATDGPLAKEGKVHPRNYGAFPRVLSKYVREDGLLSLETAVYKMTGLPAARLRLSRRGVLRPGCFADLVLFDPLKVKDTGTFSEPCSYPEGIEGVWVNGVRVMESGRHTGATPGRALRMGRAT